LGVEAIDVYLLHSPVHWCRPIEYWIEAGAKCHKLGLVRAMGLSNWYVAATRTVFVILISTSCVVLRHLTACLVYSNADQVRRAVRAGKEHGVPVVVNQVHYSLLDYNSPALQEMHGACRELGVKVVGFSPIGQGLLTDRGMEAFDTNKPAKMLRLTPRDLTELRSTLADVSKRYGKTMAQVALNWCIQHDVIPLVGCRSPGQARDSVGCLGWNLSKEDVERLDRVALDRSTLESTFVACERFLMLKPVKSSFSFFRPSHPTLLLGPSWRRMLFVSLFAGVMVVCRTLDAFGFGSVVAIKD
jgi:pyridoxine 4-dehydrogenase